MLFSKLFKIFTLLFLTLVNTSLGLYEDQVGKFDWRQKYVGRVKFSHIDLKSKLKKIFVATESNVIAALSFKTGAIIWRQVLEVGSLGEIKNFWYTGSELVTISGSGPYMVRGWNTNLGVLTFEWVLPMNDEKEQFDIDSSELYQVKFSEGSTVVTTWQFRAGNSAGPRKAVSAPWMNQDQCIVSNCNIYCLVELNGEGYSVKSLGLGESGTGRSVNIEGWTGLKPVKLKAIAGGALAIVSSDGSAKLLVPQEDTLEVQKDPTPAGVRAALIRQQDHSLILTVKHARGGYDVSGRMTESVDAVLGELGGRLDGGADGDLLDAACMTVDSRLSCAAFISAFDHSAVLLSPARIMWSREEALASIVAVEMLDLPVSDVEAAIEKEFANKEGGMLGMFVRRLVSQLGQIETLLEWLVGANSVPQDGIRTDLVKDTFGLHKLIIAVTAPAKIFGIDNRNGEIVWQSRVENVEPYIILGNPKVPLFIQRTTRVLPHPAQWTLIFKDKDSKNSVLYVFNPINGQPLGGRIALGYRVVQGTLLPTVDSNFIKGLLLMGPTPDDPVQVFPTSTFDIALATAKSIFLYVVDPEASLMSGYTMGYSNSKEGLRATLMWRVNLGGGTVLSIVAKSPQERVHSQGRVLGDRSVLYKYVNPNLLAIALQSHDPVHKSILSIQLIDAVSGCVVFSVMHKRASEPIHLVHSENWVVYSYFSDKFRRTEIVSLELYEGKTQANTTAFSSITQRITPFVERQAYIFPHHIMAMKETITEKGITSKHVLVGLGSGGIMEVPWLLLDPRRSSLGGMEMREEGLVPYIPELALPSETILSYNQTLSNIAGIITSPAGLESTSLVFVHGLDLFYTRVAPSKTFDVLKDDFEYWLISAVLLGLTVAAYITKRLASRKALRQAWK